MGWPGAHEIEAEAEADAEAESSADADADTSQGLAAASDATAAAAVSPLPPPPLSPALGGFGDFGTGSLPGRKGGPLSDSLCVEPDLRDACKD